MLKQIADYVYKSSNLKESDVKKSHSMYKNDPEVRLAQKYDKCSNINKNNKTSEVILMLNIRAAQVGKQHPAGIHLQACAPLPPTSMLLL